MSALSCQEIRERIVDETQDAALRAHVEGCAECRPILAALEGLDSDIESLAAIDAPDALVERTLARVREDAAPVTVSSPSLLAAAFAMLTSAIGAFVTAPVIALRWLLGVGSDRAAQKSLEERGKTTPRGFGLAPMFAVASLLIGLIAYSTFQTLGSTVKTKTRGAEAVVNGLPTAEENDSWWSRNADQANAPAPAMPSARAAAAEGEGYDLPTQAPTAPTPQAGFGGRFDWQQRQEGGEWAQAGDGVEASDQPAFEVAVNGLTDQTGEMDLETVPAAQTGTFATGLEDRLGTGELAQGIAQGAPGPTHAHRGPPPTTTTNLRGSPSTADSAAT